VITLSHNPDSKEALIISRGTRCSAATRTAGQCGLPLLGAALAPVRDKAFVAGLYRYADRCIHVTRGVGNLYGLRFACRPEIAMINLA